MLLFDFDGIISYETSITNRQAGGDKIKAYEFSATVTSDGKLVIPESYTKDIPVGDSVRVIILVNDKITSVVPEEEGIAEPLTLAEIIEEIKQSPQNLANIQAASGLLAEHLANSPETPDSSFDVAEWNQQWDEIEADMKKLELAEQNAEADFELP